MVEGELVTITARHGHVTLTDAKGGTVEVMTANVAQLNGLFM